MFKQLIVVLGSVFVFILPTIFPRLIPNSQALANYVCATIDGKVPLYAYSGRDKLITYITQNTSVDILASDTVTGGSEQETWLKISTGSLVGWVPAIYVRPSC